MKTKTVYLLTILLSVFIASAAFAQNQGGQGEQSGICFRPMDFDRNVCIDFRKSWYYPYSLSEWMVLHVRTSGTPAGKYIWNAGQYLMTFEEWEKIRTALAGQGLPDRCLHPEYRMTREDQVKTRKEACKL